MINILNGFGMKYSERPKDDRISGFAHGISVSLTSDFRMATSPSPGEVILIHSPYQSWKRLGRKIPNQHLLSQANSSAPAADLRSPPEDRARPLPKRCSHGRSSSSVGKLFNVLPRHRFLDREEPASNPSQTDQVSPTSDLPSDILCQGADIGSFRAGNLEADLGKIHLLDLKVEKYQLLSPSVRSPVPFGPADRGVFLPP